MRPRAMLRTMMLMGGLTCVLAVGCASRDGMATKMTADEAIAQARAGDGPTLIEAKTYRHKGHSRVDPGKYRPKEEVDEWLGRDPLPRLAERIDDDAVEQIRGRVEAELERSLDDARSAPSPDPEQPTSAYKEG